MWLQGLVTLSEFNDDEPLTMTVTFYSLREGKPREH